MRNAHVSLNKLLRVREITEQQCETVLARSLRVRNQCKQDFDEAKSSHLNQESVLREHLDGDIDLTQVQVFREQYAYCGHVVRARIATLQEAEDGVAEDRHHMIEARRDRRLVEKLQGQSRERMAAEQQQEENARLDELGVQYYQRERR